MALWKLFIILYHQAMTNQKLLTLVISTISSQKNVRFSTVQIFLWGDQIFGLIIIHVLLTEMIKHFLFSSLGTKKSFMREWPKNQISYIKVVSGTCWILKIYHWHLQSQSIRPNSNTEDKTFTMGYTLQNILQWENIHYS